MNNHPKYPRRLAAALLLGSGMTAAIVVPGAIGFAEEDPFRTRPAQPGGSRSPVRLAGIRELHAEDSETHAIRASGNSIGYVASTGTTPSIPPPFEPLKLFPGDNNNSVRYASSSRSVEQSSIGKPNLDQNASRARPVFGTWQKDDIRSSSNRLMTPPAAAPYVAFPVAGTEVPSEVTTQSPSRGVLSRGFTGWINDRTRVVREMFVGSSQTPAQPRVGQIPLIGEQPPASPQNFMGSWNPYVPFPASGGGPATGYPTSQLTGTSQRPAFQGQTSSGQMGYAGNPAYRWYGWGSTTPGANPYSPGGDYPAASASWYAMTGATPGAFPVPVVNAFRPPPGNEPPSYLVQASGTATVPNVNSRVATPPPPRPIAQSQPPRRIPVVPSALAATPTPGAATKANQATGGGDTRWQPASQPISLPVNSVMPQTSNPPPDTSWQPAQPQPYVIRGQQPDTENQDLLAERVREACSGLATSVEIRRTGQNRLQITFECSSEALSELTAHALSKVQELKPYQVEFRVRVPRH